MVTPAAVVAITLVAWAMCARAARRAVRRPTADLQA
jgi:hypothetical protein